MSLIFDFISFSFNPKALVWLFPSCVEKINVFGLYLRIALLFKVSNSGFLYVETGFRFDSWVVVKIRVPVGVP